MSLFLLRPERAAFFHERLATYQLEAVTLAFCGKVDDVVGISPKTAIILSSRLSFDGGTIISGGGVDDHGCLASGVEQAAKG